MKFLKLENLSFIPKSACLIIILKFEAYCKLNTLYTFSWGFSEILPKYLVFKTSGEGQDSKCWSADYTSLGENMKKKLWGTKAVDWNSPCRGEGAFQQGVSAQVRQREELNWESQLKSSDQQIFSTISSNDSTLIRQRLERPSLDKAPLSV